MAGTARLGRSSVCSNSMRPKWSWRRLVLGLLRCLPTVAFAASILIVRGTPTTPGALPAVVGLTYSSERGPRCSGVMIDGDMVLTAGHCLCAQAKYHIRLTHAFVGDDALDRRSATQGHFFPVTGWRAAYDCDTASSETGVDIAVVRLDRRVQGMTPMSIAAEADVLNAENLLIAGFGAIDVAGKHFDYRKRLAPVPVVSTRCDKLDVRVDGCQPGREMVAGKLNSPDTCSGDSGSPIMLVRDFKNPEAEGQLQIAGITSRGVATSPTQCGGGGIYVLLTPAVRTWISAAKTALRRQAAF